MLRENQVATDPAGRLRRVTQKIISKNNHHERHIEKSTEHCCSSDYRGYSGRDGSKPAFPSSSDTDAAAGRRHGCYNYYEVAKAKSRARFRARQTKKKRKLKYVISGH